MRADHLRKWLREARKAHEAAAAAAEEMGEMGETEVGTVTVVEAKAETEVTETAMVGAEPQEMSHWKKVVALVQAAFW